MSSNIAKLQSVKYVEKYILETLERVKNFCPQFRMSLGIVKDITFTDYNEMNCALLIIQAKKLVFAMPRQMKYATHKFHVNMTDLNFFFIYEYSFCQ